VSLQHGNVFPLHKDALGKVISVGDFVATSNHNQLILATVTKLNPKMVQIKKVGRGSKINKYSQDLVILNQKDLTIYILSTSEKV
jgi:hypothetical protein